MAVEAGDAQVLLGALAVLGLIELLLRERRQQKPQAFHLHRADQPHRQLVEVPDREQLPPRDVAELGMAGQKDRRRKLRPEMLRQVHVDIEAPQVAPLLATDLSDRLVGEDLPAGRLLDVRQRLESLRQEPLRADLPGAHRRQLVPRGVRGQPDPHPVLDRLAPARHHHARHRPVAQIVALLEQIPLPLHDCWLVGLVHRSHDAEWLRRQRPVGRVGRQGLGHGCKAAESHAGERRNPLQANPTSDPPSAWVALVRAATRHCQNAPPTVPFQGAMAHSSCDPSPSPASDLAAARAETPAVLR